MMFDGIIVLVQNTKFPKMMELFIVHIYRFKCKFVFIYGITYTWHVTGNVILILFNLSRYSFSQLNSLPKM